MEYSYDELAEKNKRKAVIKVGNILQSRLGLWKASGNSYWMDKPLLECVIKELHTVFDKDGNISFYSNKDVKTTNELLKKIVKQCKK